MVRSRLAAAGVLATLLAAACYDNGTPPKRDEKGCTLATCESAGAQCGTISDDCGGSVECGDCPSGQTCGGGGANQCGTAPCTPATCESLGASCGVVNDGCGSTLDCGGCSADQTCGGGGTPNQCGGTCQPTTCAAAGATCGTIANGCGGTLECGGCPEGQTCGGGGKENACGAPPPPTEQGGATRWVADVGGKGNEYVAGIAVRTDGVIVALTSIGGSPAHPDALGLVWLSRDGKTLADRTWPVRGSLVLGPDPIAVSPLGNVFIALQGFCEDEGCTDLGAGPLTDGALVKLSPSGDLVWSAPLPNGVASNVAADEGGGAIVASGFADAGMQPVTVRRFRWDGAPEWTWTGQTESRTALAFDGEGSVLVGQGLTVTKLDGRGQPIWSRDVAAGGGFVTAIAATGLGTVVAGGVQLTDLAVAGTTLPLPAGARAGALLASLSGVDGTPAWVTSTGPADPLRPARLGADVDLAVDPDGWIAYLVGGGGCDFRVERWAIDGQRLWSRGVDAPGCAEAAVFPSDVEVSPRHDVLVGGAFATPVDFGKGRVNGKGGRDGFVLDLAP